MSQNKINLIPEFGGGWVKAVALHFKARLPTVSSASLALYVLVRLFLAVVYSYEVKTMKRGIK